MSSPGPVPTCGSHAESHAAHRQLPPPRPTNPTAAVTPKADSFFVSAHSPNEAQPAARPPRLHRNVKPPRSAENASELECARDDARASRQRRMTAAAPEMSSLRLKSKCVLRESAAMTRHWENRLDFTRCFVHLL